MSAISSLTHAISLDPYSGEQIGTYPFDTDAALEAALQRAKVGYRQWRQVSLGQRSEYLLALADTLEAKAEAFAHMISREIGKPIAQARGEVSKCVGLCRWYAEHGPAMLAAEPTQVEKARIEYRPLGPILAVMPWNFPVWQVLRGAVPAILAGNTYVLKHAPNVMGSAYLMAELFKDAGLPEGVFEVLNVTPDGVTRAINDPRIAAVTLTGSVRAGMAIGAQAGAALKKCVLELGGSDPFIVLADADLDAAVQAAVIGRYQNTGQVCAAAKRLIVEASIVDAFTHKFVEATRQLKVGNPLEDDTYIGPMARYDLRDELDGQVQATLAEGATLLLGGNKVEGVANFYAPTVFANVTPDMTAFKQELFGPVAAIITARDADHAVELANDSEFGLASTIYTADYALAERMTAALDTGGVFINGYCASDPRVAFGGVKKSGFGRELSHFGVREFTNAQTVWLDRN
ncbi:MULTISPECIES: aldehyde dehydrogenase family protein [Pseudomonas]|jgi:succinate-semialdehyde dehydrogenase|uniref:NAD+-dependent succinate semialdehyde dehydrogenase n=1 Tax=Pseudomonas putida (strain ATCC 47054 / DSM 6125 / CFBP 8728 / NCIMB 11950 / KT2440) TaxID=160488 RepID=Q88I50_PSEPK|nr:MULTISPECIES: aldehyde dehydrogenase family protein [Pseudomonas]AAN68759.1 NAD+-dependent succinate semialdehyde dehydrogenase [Pseudomonas putida KT2440]KMU94542.1 succinate dehydrogenase [Pseudomonas putida]KMY34113.1 succinate dehydrogenase [Pseudomonas putida]MBP2841052.1 aldehyde dehydrogenase family protein [Pseudomonas sp. PNP]MDD2082297.1 aldehyde dehydrogenase family protein [Pseudomonas putida]